MSFNKKLCQPKALVVNRDGLSKAFKRCNITFRRIRKRGALMRQMKVIQAGSRQGVDTMNRREGAVDLDELSIHQPSI
jgi:hypothetical protein